MTSQLSLFAPRTRPSEPPAPTAEPRAYLPAEIAQLDAGRAKLDATLAESTARNDAMVAAYRAEHAPEPDPKHLLARPAGEPAPLPATDSPRPADCPYSACSGAGRTPDPCPSCDHRKRHRSNQ
jgi:hypothetical protein